MAAAEWTVTWRDGVTESTDDQRRHDGRGKRAQEMEGHDGKWKWLEVDEASCTNGVEGWDRWVLLWVRAVEEQRSTQRRGFGLVDGTPRFEGHSGRGERSGRGSACVRRKES
jgi:hypothetical protein